MATVTLEEAQAMLPKLIEDLPPGGEVAIVQNGEEIATLARKGGKQVACRAGCYQKAEFWMAPDFDAPLDDFKDFME